MLLNRSEQLMQPVQLQRVAAAVVAVLVGEWQVEAGCAFAAE
jgi:hypothetical protein